MSGAGAEIVSGTDTSGGCCTRTHTRSLSELDRPIEYARAKNKIEFLLKLCGDKQTQKIVHLTCESQKPFFVRKKDSTESRDKKESKDMQQNANRDSPELLELQIKSLAAQLQIRTNIHKDYVQSLLKDKDTYMQQYKSDQERFDTQINFLANRLKETQESMLHLMHNLTTVQKRSKQKQIIWIYEKDKLVQELESCKKQFGKEKKLHCPTQKVLQMLEDKVDVLEEKESQMAAEIKHYKSKLKDLERRFCLEGEGYKNDVKRLSERLKSLEKQYLKKNVPHFK
uniref:Uncharacterized protein n=1 Tax=Timema douglasi TaxID=61478 RepID=A0A7R8VXX3_TIMDO|nr:unnamed protein product [Timema douglasi]